MSMIVRMAVMRWGICEQMLRVVIMLVWALDRRACERRCGSVSLYPHIGIQAAHLCGRFFGMIWKSIDHMRQMMQRLAKERGHMGIISGIENMGTFASKFDDPQVAQVLELVRCRGRRDTSDLGKLANAVFALGERIHDSRPRWVPQRLEGLRDQQRQFRCQRRCCEEDVDSIGSARDLFGASAMAIEGSLIYLSI